MPKREPTPPLEEDFKYFIVNYPYPLHADMTIPEERYAFSHWIASCIGQQYLFAIYHKPSAPNMVIIEVAKSCPKISALLGAHKWCEFLKRPDPHQCDKESRVYYCTLSTGREVQKFGWKRLDVEDVWFRNYGPATSEFYVGDNYPKARFCETPTEVQTDYRLCRPLPVDVFPRPKPVNIKSATVGSTAWVTGKQLNLNMRPRNVVAPDSSKSGQVKSRANTVSKNTIKAGSQASVKLPRNVSSDEPETEGSPIVAVINPLISPPPGLGPPPGLPSNPSSGWDWDMPADADLKPNMLSSEDLPTSADVIIATGIGNITFDDDKEKDVKWGDDGPYWVDPDAPRKVDWDKPICPEHHKACKPGICEVMAKLERGKNRQDGDKNANDGWTQAKVGRGKSGRGRARGSSVKGNTWGGGRAPGGW